MNARQFEIEARGTTLVGDLLTPLDPIGVVVFAHGSGSSRHSPRNRAVAAVLNHAGIATLLLDLLTSEEERVDVASGRLRFDINLLASRVIGAIDRLADSEGTRALAAGLFGASTGAAAALVAAAERPERVEAVVSRGGRPDLAESALDRVRAPVLLIVGGNDHAVIEWNRAALRALGSESRLEVVPGATHLFEEPGALDAVATLAAGWFTHHFLAATARTEFVREGTAKNGA